MLKLPVLEARETRGAEKSLRTEGSLLLLLGRRAASGALMSRRCALRFGDLDLDDLRRIVGTIVAVTRQARDLLHQVEVLTLAEDAVVAVQRGIRSFGDEELRTVGIGTGIGVGEASGLIELQVRSGLVLDLEARIAGAGSLRIAALDHEVGDHAMEDGSVVERHTFFHLAGLRILPCLRAGGETDEVGHRDRSLVWKQNAMDGSESGLDVGRRLIGVLGCLLGGGVLLRRGAGAGLRRHKTAETKNGDE